MAALHHLGGDIGHQRLFLIEQIVGQFLIAQAHGRGLLVHALLILIGLHILIPSLLLTAVQKGVQRVELLAMMLRNGARQGAQLRVLKAAGIALRHAAGGGQMGQLILDDRQILAGQAASALRSHKQIPPCLIGYAHSMSHQ